MAALGSWVLAGHAAVNALLLRTPPSDSAALAAVRTRSTGGGTPHVSVLVPARNEAGRIGRCVTALLTSRGVELEIIVLDDDSSDGTLAAANAAASGDPRVRTVVGRALPPGWLGKPHACAQLAEVARGRVLAFVDADVELATDGLARAIAMLETGVLDLLCPYPRQQVRSLSTRLVQPLLQWSWLTFLPLRLAERSPHPSLVAANGQLLLCRAEDYRLAGGHGAVRAEVLEDIALARAFKRAGLRAGVVAGHDVASCTMYENWPGLRAGYTKSLWAAFGGPGGAAAVGGVLAWLYLFPPLAALRGLLRRDARRLLLGLAGTAGGIAGRMISAARTGGRVGDAPAHPLSIAVLLWLLTTSVRGRVRGDLTWRGRPVDVAAAT